MAHSHIQSTWHTVTSTFVLRGRRGTDGTGWRAWSGLVARDAAALCVAGVAQSHIHVRFAWQAWHKLTSTIVLRGRRGTDGTGWRAWSGLVARDAAALCMAGVAQHPRSFCVAGVAQTHIYHRFAWQAWHWWHWVARLVWFGRPWRRGTLRGRRGAISHPRSFCVAGVAQTHIYHRFAWQAWHWWHWVARLVWFGRPWRRGTLRGRRGTISHPRSFCVAGVAQTHIYHRFAWQAWHWWHWVALLVWFGRPWRRGTLRGRRGAISHPRSFCVAGVAQTHIYHRFAWQAWHWWYWVARLSTHNLSPQNLLTHNLSTHNSQLAHTTCPHTTCPHTTSPHTTCPHTTCHHTTSPHTIYSHTTSPHTTCHHTTSSHTTYSHTTCQPTQLTPTQLLHTQLVTTQLTHTQLLHTPLVTTQLAHTQLAHTQLVHTQLAHTQLVHTPLTHTQLTQLCHIQLFHTHNTFTHTNLHTQHCRTQLFHPTCLAPSPLLPAFPISFSHLLGDHWKKLICGVIRSFYFICFWFCGISEIQLLLVPRASPLRCLTRMRSCKRWKRRPLWQLVVKQTIIIIYYNHDHNNNNNIYIYIILIILLVIIIIIIVIIIIIIITVGLITHNAMIHC